MSVNKRECDNCTSRIRCSHRQGKDLCHGCHNGFEVREVPEEDERGEGEAPIDQWLQRHE